jgi:inorganic triphosphatase YgiF
VVELEAKLLVPDEVAFAALRAVERVGDLAAAPRETRHVEDTYVDTADLRLRRAGFGCRLRVAGDRATAGLKGLGGVDGDVHERVELEHSLDEPTVAALLRLAAEPGPTVRRLTDGEPLRTLFVVRTQRQRWRLWGVGGELEMSLDRSRIEAGGGESEVLEVELELVSGGPALVERAARELRRRYGLEPSALSKFERGLALAGLA